MNVFWVASPTIRTAGIIPQHIFASFAAWKQPAAVREMFPGCELMMDSGAYSVATGKSKVTLEQYAQFLQQHQKELDWQINFDVPPYNAESKTNWLRLQHDYGYETLPVFHILGGFRYLRYYCKHCDYVCVAASWAGWLSKIGRMAFLGKCFEIAKQYGTKIHLLGVMSPTILTYFKPYSTDSSFLSRIATLGWFLILREGKLEKFHWADGGYEIAEECRLDYNKLRCSNNYRIQVSYKAVEEFAALGHSLY